jgi:hypothetical protein
MAMQRTGRTIHLEVDGGVKADNILSIARAGADTFVAGSAIFARPTIAAPWRTCGRSSPKRPWYSQISNELRRIPFPAQHRRRGVVARG